MCEKDGGSWNGEWCDWEKKVMLKKPNSLISIESTIDETKVEALIGELEQG
jgi:hypothetical protein